MCNTAMQRCTLDFFRTLFIFSASVQTMRSSSNVKEQPFGEDAASAQPPSANWVFDSNFHF